jgi:hypothetical protein
MEASILLGNHNDCKIDTGRYVETDVMGLESHYLCTEWH